MAELVLHRMNMKQLKRPLAIIGGLFLLAFPLLFQTEIYRCLTISSDSVEHSKFIQAVASGISVNTIPIVYPAQVIFGYILGFIDKLIPILPITLFFVFSVLVLVGVGCAIYFTVSRLVDRMTGLLAVLIAVGTTNTILFLFRYGVVYNLLDMYVVLPLAIFMLVKWLIAKKWWYLAGGLALIAVFSSLHLVGIYLPFIMATILFFLLVYWIVTKHDIRHYLGLSVLVLAINLLCYKLFLSPSFTHYTPYLVPNVGQAIPQVTNIFSYVTDLKQYIMPIPLLLGVVAIYFIVRYRNYFKFNTETKYLLFILGCASLTLIGGGFLKLTSHPDRLMLDGLTLFSLCLAVFLGKAWQLKEVNLSFLKTASIIFIGASVFAKLIEWVRF